MNPEIIFLNHGSFGARPLPVFTAYQHWQRTLEAEPVAFLGRQIASLLRAVREPLAELVGAPTDDIVFVPNATHGMNIIARSLPFGPGDEVLLTSHEYGAVDRACRFVAGQRGFAARVQHIPVALTTAQAFADHLWEGVTARTRTIVISHITSPTALILPVAQICRRAAQAGIMVIVDGAHAPGQIDLDLAALGADFYVANCHKWLCT